MGNYNCRECIERDLINSKELIINNKNLSNENDSYQDKNNSRIERLNALQSNILKEGEQEKLNDNNIINNADTDISIVKRALKKKENNDNSKNKSMNKIKKEERENNLLLKTELEKINDINDIEIVSNKNNGEENKKNKIIDDISQEQQKLIELQKEQILSQQKIIEQQQLQLKEAQLKIQEKKAQLLNQKIGISNDNNNNNNNVLTKELPETNNKNADEILGYTEEVQNQEQNGQNENEQFEYYENIQMNPSHNQEMYRFEDIKNYEKIDNLDEIEDRDFHHNQSQKFKIETYEPIEEGNGNETYDVTDNYNDFENRNSNEERYIKREKNLVPKDTMKNLKSKSIAKIIKSKVILEEINRKESGPKDSSGKKHININFRGTFEGKKETNEELMQQMKIKEYGPRNSESKAEESNKKPKNKMIKKDKNKIGEEYINLNGDINYINNQENHNYNPISMTVSNTVLNSEIYDESDKNNQNEFSSQSKLENYITNQIIPISNFDVINQNNAYDSPEEQNESPRFNEIVENQNQQIYNEGNNMQSFLNSVNIGNYINQNNEYASNEIYNNNIMDQNQYEKENSDINNNLVYSNDIGNMNYLEQNYELYQNQV